MKPRDITFEVPDRGEVSGIVLRPRGARALYVLAHGAGADMRHRFMEATAVALAERGIATMRFCFPYTEAGRRRPDHKAVLLETIRAAVDVAAKQARGLPLFAGGKSMGGRMTSLAASEAPLPGVRGVIFLGFPLHAPGREGTERADHLAAVGPPMLFVQGTRDKLADLTLLGPVVKRLGKSATMHIIDGGDHSLGVPKRSGRTFDDVLTEFTDRIAAWIDAQLANASGHTAGSP